MAMLGHSLGEYNALLVSGAFDFETGLKIVVKRGELMAAPSGGGMAAVIGLREVKVRSCAGTGRPLWSPGAVGGNIV